MSDGTGVSIRRGPDQRGGTLPVVWLFGTPGVGKSTIGYRLLSSLGDAGLQAAYVDADQLRLAGNVSASETDLIASALPTLERGYRAYGAQVMIVGGLADDQSHLAALLSGIPREGVLAVHLGADADTIRERLRWRGWPVELVDKAVQYAERLDPGFADLHIDVTDKTPAILVAKIADAILAHLNQLTPGKESPTAATPQPVVPRRIIFLTGPGGVGISTVGFETFSRLARAGEPAGYIDAHQLGFLGTGKREDRLAPMRAANARAVAGSLAAGGARTLVISGEPRTVRLLIDTWDTTMQVFWLHASSAVLAERITLQSRGKGPQIPGDHRAGLTGPALAEAIASAINESGQSGLRPDGALVIDTSSMSPAQVADAIVGTVATKDEERA